MNCQKCRDKADDIDVYVDKALGRVHYHRCRKCKRVEGDYENKIKRYLEVEGIVESMEVDDLMKKGGKLLCKEANRLYKELLKIKR